MHLKCHIRSFAQSKLCGVCIYLPRILGSISQKRTKDDWAVFLWAKSAISHRLIKQKMHCKFAFKIEKLVECRFLKLELYDDIDDWCSYESCQIRIQILMILYQLHGLFALTGAFDVIMPQYSSTHPAIFCVSCSPRYVEHYCN